MNTKQTLLISKIFVTSIVLWLCFVWWQNDVVTIKEMQIMSIAETHANKGLSFTKGYNFYPEFGGNYSEVSGA